MTDTATMALPAVKVKMVQWFDDHFYKVQYTQDQCPACKKPKHVYYLPATKTCDCEDPNAFGVTRSGTPVPTPIPTDIVDYLPSVTTRLGAVAKPFLTMWYGDLGTREAQLRKMEAAERGSRLHHAWETFTKGGLIVWQDERRPNYSWQELQELDKQYEGNIAVLYTQEEMYDMTKLQRFYDAIKPENLVAERTLYSLLGRDAGTCDNAFDVPGGLYKVAGSTLLELPKGRYIFDLKTGKYVGREAKMQVSRYAKMHEEMGLGPIAGALIGHTQATTRSGIEGFQTLYVSRAEIEAFNEDYKHVAHMWDREFGSMKPQIFDIPTLITLTKKEKVS